MAVSDSRHLLITANEGWKPVKCAEFVGHDPHTVRATGAHGTKQGTERRQIATAIREIASIYERR